MMYADQGVGGVSAFQGFEQLDVDLEDAGSTIRIWLKPNGRATFNVGMLRELSDLQDMVLARHAAGDIPVRHLVLGSRNPGVFSLGGDLDLFVERIEAQDRKALLEYGRLSVRVIERNHRSLDLPFLTVALVQGETIGGGFETVLSFDVIVAERGARFGLPEMNFGLFAGMGAHSFLTRKLGAAAAARIIGDGRFYSAEEMFELGIVTILAEPGEGERAVRDYIAGNERRHAGRLALKRAAALVNPVTLDEMEAVMEVWANAALRLCERDLKIMRRLVAAQDRLRIAS